MPARRGARVLVVDDDAVIRQFAKTILSRAGFTVTVSKDGVAALARLRREKFDVLLIDVWMPRLGGLTVLDRMTKGKARPKVIVMTSDTAPETQLQAIRQQTAEYISKPFDAATLVERVRDVLAREALPPIEVVSARSNWVELLVPCQRAMADRLESVMERLEADLPASMRESIGYAFRELLMNAIEWGGKLDPKRKVRIAYVRAEKMLMYRIADPGPGFSMKNLTHAAISHPDDPIEHMRIREEKGIRPGGFGLLMVRAKVDELIYNEKHNEVIFVKYLDASRPA